MLDAHDSPAGAWQLDSVAPKQHTGVAPLHESDAPHASSAPASAAWGQAVADASEPSGPAAPASLPPSPAAPPSVGTQTVPRSQISPTLHVPFE